MSEASTPSFHPIAPRVKGTGGRPKPHVGPSRADYELFHGKTIGPQSDEWWTKVSLDVADISSSFVLITNQLVGGARYPLLGQALLHGSLRLLRVRRYFLVPGGCPERLLQLCRQVGLQAPRQSLCLSPPFSPTHRPHPLSSLQTAIIYEADEPGEGRKISYAELLREVCAVANVLKSFGVKKGDTVSIYLPMTWQAVAAFLACARIGAMHSVVFAGFSAESLRDRVQDCKCRVVITTDEGRRGGKTIATKAIVDAALKECPLVEHVLVLERTGKTVSWVEGRDKWWHEETAKVPRYCPPEVMASEAPLFILYVCTPCIFCSKVIHRVFFFPKTSGSTGKPKGVVHSTAGYLLGAALTVKYVFDVHPDDRFACMADVGWITGHTYVLWPVLNTSLTGVVIYSYIIYGPLANGVSTVMYESTPVYPTPSRYWEVVQAHKLTHFYSAPTAIRLLRRLGHQHVEGHDLESLRVLGSVGEPINPEAWHWYNEHVGRKQCAIVDTFW